MAHPYYPPGLVLAHYIANTRDVQTICSIAGFTVAALLLISWRAATQYDRGLSSRDKMVMLWFVLSLSSQVPVSLPLTAQMAPQTSSSKDTL